MWRAELKCTRDPDHHYERTVEVERSPFVEPVRAGNCPMCDKPLRLGKVEDLRPRQYNIRRKKRKSGGMTADTLPLF